MGRAAMTTSSWTREDLLPDTMPTFRAGVVACTPTILGYWSIGFASGAIGSGAGFSIQQIALLSGLLYAGSAQFLIYSLVAAGAGLAPIVLGVLLINMRYVLMSSYLAMFFGEKAFWEKLLGGLLLTDETFGVASEFAAREGGLPTPWLFGLNIAAYVNWIVANIAGALAASMFSPALAKGLNFSLTAMFIGLLLLAYFSSKHQWLDLFAALIAVLAVALSFGRIDINFGILIATLIAASVGAALYCGVQRFQDYLQ